jgi:hypothetical protein
MKGVEDRQMKMLQQRKEILIEKRRRRAEREAVEAEVGPLSPVPAVPAVEEQTTTAGVLAATS